MPLYEYQCDECQEIFEKLVPLSDESRETRDCDCGGLANRLISELGKVYHPTRSMNS